MDVPFRLIFSSFPPIGGGHFCPLTIVYNDRISLHFKSFIRTATYLYLFLFVSTGHFWSLQSKGIIRRLTDVDENLSNWMNMVLCFLRLLR